MDEASRADGDLNGDGTVGFEDFLIVNQYFGTSAPSPGDTPTLELSDLAETA